MEMGYLQADGEIQLEIPTARPLQTTFHVPVTPLQGCITFTLAIYQPFVGFFMFLHSKATIIV